MNSKKRSISGLPTVSDFDPNGGGLDAQWAWRIFGKLTIPEARVKFEENPLSYQEAFMWMGGVAFAYYFPVIEEFLYASPVKCDDYDDRQAWILASCIKMQFDQAESLPHVLPLAPRVLSLAEFVCGHLGRFSSHKREQQRIVKAWEQLVAQVRLVM